MSEFVESEAEESEDEQIGTKRRKRQFEDEEDEEEEEDDEEKLREEMKDLINDDEEEQEEEGSGSGSGSGSDDDDADNRKKKKHREDDDALEDDDYALIEENLGIKVQRKKKFKRLRRIEDDDESDREEPAEEDAREQIANDLFEGSDEGEIREEHPAEEDDRFREMSGSEMESDEDDFIVDDEGQPISKGKKRRHVRYTDAALQEAQDIFGVDFDYKDFEQYGDEYEEELEEEEYEDEEEDGEARPRQQKKHKRKRPARKSIFDVFEPSELIRGHLTDLDNKIKATDVPERFQLRAVPVTTADEEEIDEESQWIYKQAFSNTTLSIQGPPSEQIDSRQPVGGRKAPGAVSKIREALKFMRNQQLEVPFIAFYRKEYVEPDLNISDLWIVYKWDEKWCQLRSRKQNLHKLFERMQQYQCDQVMRDRDQPLADNIRLIDEGDFERLKEVQNPEELRDCYRNFMLHYSHEVPHMQEANKAQKEGQQNSLDDNGNKEDEPRTTQEDAELTRVKHGIRKDLYGVCRDAGLDGLAKKFGLTPEQFGENLRDNYQRHEVDQYPVEPLELAGDFTTKRFNKAEEVLRVGRFMVAIQIAREPLVRREVRQVYLERAKISVVPTRKGLKEVDESHPCYSMKYLKNKPIGDLVGEQFLKLTMAEDDGLLRIKIAAEKEGERQTFLEDIKQLYYKDEFSRNVQKWNEQRSLALDLAMTKFLYPDFEREIRTTLLQESKDGIVKACSRKLYNWIRIAPYQVDQQMEEDEDYDTRDGLRIMGLAYQPDRSIPAFCALIDGEGEMTDFLRLRHILCRRNAWKEEERQLKESDLKALRRFILNKKPHVVVVGGESREALGIVEDVRSVINDLGESEQMPPIGVEHLDNELSNVYMNSKKAESDFRDYPGLLRQAVSLARRLQDPLVEFSQLCNYDEEIFCVRYHPLQEHVSRDDLMSSLYLEFVNRTNEVGVDVNRAINHPHTANLLQFICGLGPRKASQLVKMLKQNHQRLESRTQLVTVCKLGPQVFINCAGFIRIDTSSLGDSTDAYVEVLDGSRVHPEGYDWARKMAVDALEYDDMAEDVNPAGALEEILENPEKLKDLDLDAFAEELERQGFGNKSISLYDIRAELNHRYKDLRTPYRACNPEEIFNMLTKETPETFYIGKLVLSTVVGIARRKPQGEQLDQANPNRTDDTGLWQCPFCLKNDFPELSEVWNHFDAGSCPGQAMGVRARLDNAVSGFIPTKMISDKRVTNPEDRVKIGMTINCRITKINIEKFSVELTCRSSDLADKNNEWKPAKDLYFDYDAEDRDRKVEEEHQKKQNRQTYIKRVIVHPSFHNIGFKEADKLLSTMDQGDVIIRPSSKGVDHLTVTWKVHGNINQHIDVREEGKENAFSLGQSLWINNEEFEDLDEIIARYVQPMAAGAREVVAFKYFRDAEGGKPQALEKLLTEEKKKATSRIPYLLSTSREYPGKFLLYYMPRNKARHEFITVTPDGFRFRQHTFHTLNSLFKWFKEHFRDPIPGTPASVAARTPAGRSSAYIGATPSINLANVDPQAIQRAAASLPRHLFNTLSQVAGQTPGFQSSGYAPGYSGASQTAPFGYQQQPYTPSQPMATPLMTPSYHTVPTTPAATTPRYPPQTPQNNWQQTPRAQTPRQTPKAQTPTHPSSNALASNPTPTDWRRMAEQWAKKRQQSQDPKPRSTPRSTPQHHFPSPMVESTPAGDATPLIDEH